MLNFSDRAVVCRPVLHAAFDDDMDGSLSKEEVFNLVYWLWALGGIPLKAAPASKRVLSADHLPELSSDVHGTVIRSHWSTSVLYSAFSCA